MKVLIYEPNIGGHYFMFLKYLVEAIHKLGVRPILVLSQDAPLSVRYREHLEPIADMFELDACVDPAWHRKVSRRRRNYTHLLKEALGRHKPDHAYVPSADSFLPWLCTYTIAKLWKIPPGLELECTAINSKIFYSRSDGLGHAAIRNWFWWNAMAMAHPAIIPCIIDAVAYENVIATHPKLARRLVHLPETIGRVAPLTKTEARRMLGIPEGGRYISLPGLVTCGKGADILLRGFAAESLGTEDRLLLAGAVHPKIRQMLETEFGGLIKSGRIIVIDGVLPDRLLDAAVAAADVVAVLYQKHFGGSNITHRAAFYGRPILASRFAWAARMVPLLKLGWMVDSARPEVVGRALQKALQSAETYVPSPASKTLADFCSKENFQACWTARLARRLGRSEMLRIRWDDVVARTEHTAHNPSAPLPATA